MKSRNVEACLDSGEGDELINEELKRLMWWRKAAAKSRVILRPNYNSNA